MSTESDSRAVVIQGSASDLAFRAGQLVERWLVDRGTEIAQRSESGTVKVREGDIRAAFDPSILDLLRDVLGAADDEEQVRRLSA